ncbi:MULTISPECIES: MotA/TolQ/ExbB proton channel family protein [unclassified Thermosynechococcus]|uniref:MotA/TolQ/ExbB proton channel family protein n=1 Tax=unclassified Thermosynechococcus TaxID=2622553 RepID=UPI002873D268|nr:MULTISPECIES: MotA/TolQ/ExbB proton channel family protein [unclassified Thermosynechococcus]WNC32564.1 MotA/TolQ/ExbB proton channel family protein [Thermosynechococcus sp. PKX95]WNC35094.1 MotA/TolQ/ExbB proton channel family protein [Thermosynechococcus sp. PKX91]WNC37610.1 MotA/TolQ/ExbB proton channel family protein [Thermosynechococcus sp. WL11]WNC40131.1 MotA/TolQ/ExbB proton channel family protein [Thermosynechococcus sp. WL17]WNC42651.1 MotA/TolQ/ExbB proton channel family protein 
MTASSPVSTTTAPSLTPVAVPRQDLTVPLWLALAIAAVATVILYIFFLPLQGTYLGQLLLNRGWTQPVAVFFAWTVLVFTILKAIALFQQAPSLRQIWIPANYPFTSMRDILQLQQTLAQRRTLLPNRCARVLGAFLSSGQREIAVEAAAEESGSAAAATDASYTIPRVLVWAIPLLGFIGTVVGISQAVSGFSSFLETAQDVNQIKEGIGGVTTGLAVAFDTTLVALVLSVLVMIPMVIVERWENKLLLQIDTYINDQLLPRLPVTNTSAGVDRDTLQDMIQETIRTELPTEERLQQLLDNLNQLARAVVRDRQQFVATLEERQQQSIEQFERLVTQIQHSQGELLAHVNQEQTAIAQELRQQSQYIAQLLAESDRTLQQRLQLLETLNQALQALADTGNLQLLLDRLNHTLASLQPVLRQLAQPRRLMLVEQPRLYEYEEDRPQK